MAWGTTFEGAGQLAGKGIEKSQECIKVELINNLFSKLKN